jgi:hypothetical protein
MRRTVEIAPSGPRPSISLRPAPQCEPPFDDELEPAVWATAHQLALDWHTTKSTEPQAPPPPVHRSVVAGASHDAKLAVHRFVRLCVEVFNGHRPPHHLRHVSRPSDAAGVVAQAQSAIKRIAAHRKATRSPTRHPPRRPPPVAVIRLRLCEPRSGAVEAAVALVTGDRTWALALRMEQHQESWSATTLRLI